MSDPRNKIEEQALDALLVEALEQVEPPDLTARILARLSETENAGGAPAIVESGPNRAKPAPRRAMPAHVLTWTAGLTAALAASLLLALWLRGSNDSRGVVEIAANQPGVGETAKPADPAPEAVVEADANPGPVTRPRGIPLVIDSASNPPRDQPAVESGVVPESRQPLPAVTLVSKQFDAEILQYWNAIGIAPAAEAEASEVVARLESTLGVKLPAEALSDPESLQDQLARPQAAREVASRWLQWITDGGLQRLDEEARESLTAELAACLQGDRPFDRTVASWIDGQSPRASSFYRAMSHSGQDAMARRLASLTMNVDLRCIRCHDATIEGSGRQEEYWSFTALLDRGVSRDAEGRLTIDPPSNRNKSLFYELPDGRQRLAEPRVASSWLDGANERPAESVKAWADQLVGSEVMARGAVNSLWELVHGQPLQGRVVDPITAPHHESLDRIEAALVEDLMRSQFNVARTLSLIIASPTMRRGVPSPLLPENALVATEEEKRQAIDAVNAFAAALPRRANLTLSQRLDQAMRAVGGKLDQDGQPFVAQIGVTGDERSVGKATPGGKPLSVDFPVRDDSLPVQWLTLLEDEKSQIDHLAYLAGMRNLPESVRGAVEAMQKDEQLSKELRLNRVWWLVRP